MSATPELLYGSRPAASVRLLDREIEAEGGAPVVIENAELLYILHETPMRTTIPSLPASLHPSVPAVLGITFVKAPQSPWGPFIAAWVGIACRTGIKPRHFITAAFCNNAVAADFLASRYGFNCQAADVGYRETFVRVRGVVEVDGRLVLDAATIESLPLVGIGATIKYSPALNGMRLGSGPALVQFEAAYDFKRVLRGRPRLAHYDSTALGEASVIPTTPIAGSHAVCDLHLLPARFQVDLAVPAEAGGAGKIAR